MTKNLRALRLLQLALVATLTIASAVAQTTVTVTCSLTSVPIGGTRQLTATVTGTSNTAVTWSVNGVANGNATVGTVNTSGLYTAPPVIPSPDTVTIAATSVASPTVSGAFQMAVRNQVPYLTAVNPMAIPVGAFSLTITGSRYVSGATVLFGGSPLPTVFVSSTQLTATGTATLAQTGAVAVTVMNPGTVASSVINVTVGSPPPQVSVSVSPTSVAFAPGTAQQFSSTVTNSMDSSVTWSVNGVNGGNSTVGTVSAAGLYTAPAVVPNPATVTVKATSVPSPTASGSATVTIAVPQLSITTVTPSTVPVGAFSLTVNGAGFVSGSVVNFGGSPLPTVYVSATQLTASGTSTNAQLGLVALNVSNPAPVAGTSNTVTVKVGSGPGLVSSAVASRFLEQAAFGPSPISVSHVAQVGLQGYLTEQFATGPVSNYRVPGGGFAPSMPARFFTNAVNGSDQLRQRVSFALSQIFVISLNKLNWASEVIPFEEMLHANAFGNVRPLLQLVTLHPSMGIYLDMVNNDKANAVSGTLPNENYAREVMQLFTLGTWLLNPDGTQQLDAQGNPIPTYNQNTITEFARVYTGWTFAPLPGKPMYAHNNTNTTAPMVSYQPNHDTEPKALLNAKVLPLGHTADQDLSDALDNIFQHANMGPFFGKLMIQHLVMSNPSPAYVQRVAAAFNDNGQGVRGDMQAILTAILLDPEARQGDTTLGQPATDGHLQEPALFVAGLLRALNAYVDDSNYFAYEMRNMSQDLFNSPSVFNYFSPNNHIAGGLLGPEFQIYTPYSAVYRANLVSNLFSSYSNNINSYGPGTVVDLTQYVNMAGTPNTLVDALDTALTHGQMPSSMKQTITTAVSGTSGNLRRAQVAIYLIATSGFYNVWH